MILKPGLFRISRAQIHGNADSKFNNSNVTCAKRHLAISIIYCTWCFPEFSSCCDRVFCRFDTATEKFIILLSVHNIVCGAQTRLLANRYNKPVTPHKNRKYVCQNKMCSSHKLLHIILSWWNEVRSSFYYTPAYSSTSLLQH